MWCSKSGQPHAFHGWRLRPLRSTAWTEETNITPAHTALRPKRLCPHSGGVKGSAGAYVNSLLLWLPSLQPFRNHCFPSVCTSLWKVKPDCRISLLLHHLHGFPNSSFTLERWQSLACIVVYDCYAHQCHSWPQDTFVQIRRRYFSMWGQKCGQIKAQCGQWSRDGMKVPLALSGHLGKAHLHHCLSWATPDPGETITLQRPTKTPEHASSCQWVDMPLPLGEGQRRWECLELKVPTLDWDTSFLVGNSLWGPKGQSSLIHAPACDRKFVKNRPESLPGLPMNFV